jgi:hypothetical protein
MCGGGVVTVLSHTIYSFKCRHDLESCDECVLVEIPTYDGLNLLIGTCYSPPLILNLNIFLVTFSF